MRGPAGLGLNLHRRDHGGVNIQGWGLGGSACLRLTQQVSPTMPGYSKAVMLKHAPLTGSASDRWGGGSCRAGGWGPTWRLGDAGERGLEPGQLLGREHRWGCHGCRSWTKIGRRFSVEHLRVERRTKYLPARADSACSHVAVWSTICSCAPWFQMTHTVPLLSHAHRGLVLIVPSLTTFKVGAVLKSAVNNDFFSQELSQIIRKALV